MGEFPLIQGARYSENGQSTLSAGVTVTAAGTANTKGSWAQLQASTPFESAWMLVQVHNISIADYLVDIGYGTAGNEQVLIENLPIGQGNGIAPAYWFFPIHLDDGERLVARCQASTLSLTCRVQVHLIAGDFGILPPCSRVATYGANTADSGGTSIDAGATVHTKGAWQEIVASTLFDHSWLGIGFGNQINVGRTSGSYMVDIAMGPSGNEQILIPNLVLYCHANADMVAPQGIGCLPTSVPAGSRLAARMQSAVNDATDRLIDIILYGVG